MKYINYLPVTIAALALNSGGIALGQLEEFDPPTVYQHKMTIDLTLAEEGASTEKATKKTTTSSSKILRSKVTNKIFLDLFVELGEIEEISGWSIVGASDDNDNEESSALEGIYLVKDGADPVNVSEYFDIEYSKNSIEAYKEVTNDKTDAFKGTYSESRNASFDFSCDIDEESYIQIDLDTIATEKGAYSRASGEESLTSILTSMEFNHGTGAYYDYQEEDFGIVRGSYDFGNGTESNIVLRHRVIIINEPD